MEIETAAPELSTGFDLKSIVEESKQKFHSVDPIKQRGRPPGKYGAYKKRSAKSVQNSSENYNEERAEIKAPPPDISQFLITPLTIVSRIPATKYRIEELALDKTEVQAVAESIDGLFKAFVPDLEAMSPKTAAVLSFGLVTSSIFVSKYEIYAQRQAEMVFNSNEPELNDENKILNSELNNLPPKTSLEYFKNVSTNR